MGDGNDHLLALDQVLVLDPVPGGRDLGNARRRIGVADVLELLAHDAIQLHAIGKDREILLDRDAQFLELVADFVPPQSGETMEAEVEDRLHLPFGQAIGPARLLVGRFDRFDQSNILRDVADRPFLREQLGARIGGIGRSADHRHDLIEVRHGDHEAEQDVRPFARLVQFELGATRDHFFAE